MGVAELPKLSVRLPGAVDPRHCVDLANIAEANGFHSLWFAENAFNRGVLPAASACAAESGDSLMGKPRRILSQVLCVNSRPKWCSAITMAVYGSDPANKAFCMCTKEQPMYFRSLTAFQATAIRRSLRIERAIFG